MLTKLELRPQDLEIGEVVAGRWEIVDLVGRGGVGCIYRADDHEGGPMAALKVLRPIASIAGRSRPGSRSKLVRCVP